MDVAIAIRTAVLKDAVLHVQAAAGVVADSDPQSEWQETLHKARAILRAAEIATAEYAGNRGGEIGVRPQPREPGSDPREKIGV
jgi:anthranilate synthase component 1